MYMYVGVYCVVCELLPMGVHYLRLHIRINSNTTLAHDYLAVNGVCEPHGIIWYTPDNQLTCTHTLSSPTLSHTHAHTHARTHARTHAHTHTHTAKKNLAPSALAGLASKLDLTTVKLRKTGLAEQMLAEQAMEGDNRAASPNPASMANMDTTHPVMLVQIKGLSLLFAMLCCSLCLHVCVVWCKVTVAIPLTDICYLLS